MIEFLDGPALGAKLPELCRSSNGIRIAVAFCGRGAVDVLGGPASLTRARMVCNLRSGGTNPEVIRQLSAAGAQVKHSDDLHAKLYVFDNRAVVGSSNLSANGLSFQGNEAEGWTESNIIFDRGDSPYADAERQFEDIWRRAKTVEDTDLVIAEEAWSRRRRIGFARRTSKAPDVLSALTSTPDQFEGRRIYLTVDNLERSAASEAKLKSERKRQHASEELDCWEGWESMPDDATFVCFWRGPRGGLRPDGFWYSPAPREEVVNREGVKLQLIHRLDHIDGIKRVGDLRRWSELIERVREQQTSGEDGTFEVEFGRLAREFLNE